MNKQIAVTRKDKKDINQFKRDTLFLEKHRDELVSKHPNRWVAVYKRQVQAVDSDLKNLLKTLDQKGLPRGQTVVEFLSTERKLLIVPHGLMSGVIKWSAATSNQSRISPDLMSSQNYTFPTLIWNKASNYW